MPDPVSLRDLELVAGALDLYPAAAWFEIHRYLTGSGNGISEAAVLAALDALRPIPEAFPTEGATP